MKTQDVEATNWKAAHQDLVATGYLRFEFLTATHIGADEFQVISKVSTEDLADSVLTITRTSAAIHSLLAIYKNAEFSEQETAQMFGLQFIGHEDLQKAFDVDFDDYPMRRNFGLSSRQQRPWPGAVEPDAKARRRPSLPPGVLESWNE